MRDCGRAEQMTGPASVERLGRRQASYAPEPQRWAATAAGGLVLAAVLALAATEPASVSWGWVPLLLATAAFAAMTAGRVRAARRGVNARLDVFEHGAAVTLSDGRVFAFPWAETSILYDIVDSRKNGAAVTSYRCALAGPDRVAVVIGTSLAKPPLRYLGVSEHVRGARFERAEEWMLRIRQRVTEARLPEAAQAVQEGRSLSFGPITVHRDRIEDGDRTLPWTRVRDFHLVNGRLYVRGEGRRPVVKRPVSAIPDFFVLYSLGRALAE
jgi:hypothetical protein